MLLYIVSPYMTYNIVFTLVLQIKVIFSSISFNLVAPSPASCNDITPSELTLVTNALVALPAYSVHLIQRHQAFRVDIHSH